MNTQQKQIGGAVIIAVAALGLGFYGGTTYAASHPATRGFAAGAPGQRTFTVGGFTGGAAGQARGARTAGGFVKGTVLSKDATSITVKMMNGSSMIVLLSPSTTVAKSTSGTIDDVAVGSSVTVTGTPNSDGSLTGASIQIRPMVSSGQ